MKRSLLSTSLIFIILMLLSAPVFAQELQAPETPSPHATLSLLDQFGGGAYGMAIDGDYVYAAIGPRLVALKQDETGRLHVVSETKPFDNMLHSVVISGSYAYVAEYRYIGWTQSIGRLHIIDISQPNAVREVKTLSGILALDMAVGNGHLFIAANDGFYIFDLSHAPDIKKMGFVKRSADSIIVHDNLAFLLRWNGQLDVYDVTDSSNPTHLSTFVWGRDQAWDMTLDFPYLTIANGHSGITTIDVTDPTHPVQIENIPTEPYAMAVTQSEDHVFVASGGRLVVFDKLPQGRLRKVNDDLWLASTTRQMAVQSHWLFAAAGGPDWDYGGNYGGLFVFNIDTPEHPARSQWLSRVSHARAVKWHDTHLYVAGDEGMYILDAHDHQILQQRAFFSTYGAESIDVQKQGDATYAFLAQRWRGLEIVNVTDPTAPVSLSRFMPQQTLNVSKVIVDGAYAYLGISNSQTPLIVLDISSPADPRQIAAFHAETRSVSMVKQADKIYLVDGAAIMAATMSIIDISDPTRPTLVGTLTMHDGTSLHEIVVEGNTAFIATSERGVRVVDVSHPDAPQLVGSISLPPFANHIQVQGHFLLTSHFMDGTMQGRLYLTDVSNPLQPVILSYVDTAGEPYQAIFHQDDIFAPDGPGGVRLYQIMTLDHQLFQPFTLLSR